MKTQKIHKNLKLIFIYTFILISFLPIFHINILKAYFSPLFTDHAPSDAGAIHDFYLRVSGPILHVSDKIGMSNLWKFVSPVPKENFYVNWYGKNREGIWELIELPNLSPEYRKQRSSLNIWFWDFKLARFEQGLTNFKIYRNQYAAYLCKHIQSNGQQLQQIKAESVIKTIPTPNQDNVLSWTKAEVNRITKYEIFSCQ